jgi:pimeloyl-ACP methyl ester carboxylesterase
MARRGAVIPRPISVDLGKITAPTLVLAAAEDRLIPPAHTLSLAREIANAKTVTISGVGHVATRQNPAAVAAAVKAFLQEEKSQRHITEEDDHGRSKGGSRRAL